MGPQQDRVWHPFKLRSEPHWAVENFSSEWPQVSINPPILPPSSQLFFLFLHWTSGANQQLFVQCQLTNDSPVEERKTTWGVAEVQQAGVTASERRGGWKKNRRARGSWECVRRNNRESVTGKYPAHFVCARFFSFCFLHSCSTPHMDGEHNSCGVFICRPVELLLAVTGHCVWMCSRNASAWLYMSTAELFPISDFLHSMKLYPVSKTSGPARGIGSIGHC